MFANFTRAVAATFLMASGFVIPVLPLSCLSAGCGVEPNELLTRGHIFFTEHVRPDHVHEHEHDGIPEHEHNHSHPELVAVNGTDGQDGANGQDGRDGRDGVDGTDGVNGTTAIVGVWIAPFNGARYDCDGDDIPDGCIDYMDIWECSLESDPVTCFAPLGCVPHSEAIGGCGEL